MIAFIGKHELNDFIRVLAFLWIDTDPEKVDKGFRRRSNGFSSRRNQFREATFPYTPFRRFAQSRVTGAESRGSDSAPVRYNFVSG